MPKILFKTDDDYGSPHIVGEIVDAEIKGQGIALVPCSVLASFDEVWVEDLSEGDWKVAFRPSAFEIVEEPKEEPKVLWEYWDRINSRWSLMAHVTSEDEAYRKICEWHTNAGVKKIRKVLAYPTDEVHEIDTTYRG